MQITHQSGITAQWQSLVSEAEDLNGIKLDTQLESYLVHTLVRYTAKPDMAMRVLALEYLNAVQHLGQQRQDQLRDVGDQCLLFAGLFPMRARRRTVKISYYVDIGRSAYQGIADTVNDWSDVYAELACKFVTLMDTLHAIRKIGGNHEMDMMGAYELAADCDSMQAQQTMNELTDAKVVVFPQHKKH